MKDKLTSYDPEPFLSLCAWCGKAIPENTECFGAGGKTRDGINVRKHEGRVIIMVTGDREVPCLVTTRDSQAKKDGKDLMFMLCSELCGQKLKAAFRQDRALIGDSPLDSFGEK